MNEQAVETAAEDTALAPREDLRWYVLAARPGQENSVATDLSGRISRSEFADLFGRVLVPTEEVVELKNGQKKISRRKFFPGYVLVQIATSNDETGTPMIDSQAWHLAKETSKVTGFVGGTSARPLPMADHEADAILERVDVALAKPRPKTLFEVGSTVKVVAGPFNDFNGIVDEVDYDRAKVKVSILVFGRATPVDLAFDQVAAA